MKKVLVRLVRQSPAMIVAMLALFVALTGTAVATSSALITGNQIKNNSITGADVRNNSITGADVKNKSLTARDIRGQLRGPRGLRGLTGAAGAAGAKGDKGDKGDPATRLWGVVAADGTLVRNAGVTSVTKEVGLGTYLVEFSQDINACSYATSVAHFTNTDPGSGATRANTAVIAPNENRKIRVRTTDLAGTLSDRNFHIQVFC